VSCCSVCDQLGPRRCDERKRDQRRLAAELLARTYPSRRFGAPDDEARFRRGLGRTALARLAAAVSQAAAAPARVVPGAEEDLCDYVYLLCLGREPGLLAVQAGAAPLPPPPVRDRYLRIAVSSLGPVAAVQELELRLDAVDPGPDSAAARLSELTRSGVYEEALLPRYRRVVTALESARIHHLDFDVLEDEPAGYDGSAYRDSFGAAPTVLNYLFFPWPARTVATEYLATSR
jgi:hypothetical protein